MSAPYLIDISIDDSYSQNGGVLIDENNSAAGYGDGPSTAAGGFMYLGLSEVTFDIADGKTLVIGNTENDGAVDSIAGTGVITKTGSGDLVLNADNNDFTGEMQIENGEVTWPQQLPDECRRYALPGRSARLLWSDDREY